MTSQLLPNAKAEYITSTVFRANEPTILTGIADTQYILHLKPEALIMAHNAEITVDGTAEAFWVGLMFESWKFSSHTPQSGIAQILAVRLEVIDELGTQPCAEIIGSVERTVCKQMNY